MTDRNADLRPGHVVAGRYEILEVLGRGGMGVVYDALQGALARKVALKVLCPDRAEGVRARARFEREARVAAALSHPGAVEIHDFGEDDGSLFLAMERLEGPTLRQALRAGPMPIVDLVEVAVGIAGVLVAAHGMGLVHRDLKPANVFLEPDSAGSMRVVVADFGLAFIAGRPDAGRLTRDGLMAGTPGYVSPEQALGREVGPGADLYSLGCTLYEMATGRLPFEDPSEVAVVTQHLFALPRPPRVLRPGGDLPRGLDSLILRLLAKRPEERPEAPEVLEQLETVRTGHGGRERSRGETATRRRAERMLPPTEVELSAVTVTAAPSPSLALPRLRLAVIGRVDSALSFALAARGVEATPASVGEVPPESDAVFAPGSPPKALARLVALGVPVLADADPGDIARVAALLRVGVAEAVPCPVSPEDLARRAHRAVDALRRARRRR